MKLDKSKPIRTTLLGLATAIIIPILWIAGPHLISSFEPKYRPHPWPPVVNQDFPDLNLIDQNAEKIKLSYFKNKVIILQPTAMSSAASQSLSGSKTHGSFQNVPNMSVIRSVKDLLFHTTKYTHLPNKDIVYIHWLISDPNGKHPTLKDTQNWAKHFKAYKGNNEFVVRTPKSIIDDVSLAMIPGIMVIGKDFKLRVNSTGPRPQHNLETQAIPFIPKLLK